MRTRDWTQGQLALFSGVRQPHISQIIRGERRPRIDIAIALADALDVSLDWLAGRDRKHQPALTPEEQELLRVFRQFDEAEQSLALDLIQTLVKSRPRDGDK
ncbi:MAG: helix-turn-helix domain-containing protein [Anaerolineae bacterium]